VLLEHSRTATQTPSLHDGVDPEQCASISHWAHFPDRQWGVFPSQSDAFWQVLADVTFFMRKYKPNNAPNAANTAPTMRAMVRGFINILRWTSLQKKDRKKSLASQLLRLHKKE
jgi:hypothetical protein